MKWGKLLVATALACSCVSSENPPDGSAPSSTATTAATTATPAATTAVPQTSWKLLASGTAGLAAQNTGGGRMAPYMLVATSADEFEPLWRQHISASPSGVTLGDRVAAFLLMPSRPSGGYSIAVRGVTVAGTTATIDAELIEPAAGSITTQAFTAPYAVVAVPAGVQLIEWRSNGRLVRAAEVRPIGSGYP